MESKKMIYDLIPCSYYPRTLFFPLPASPEMVIDAVKENKFNFPLIAKPDIGARGMGVRKLYNEKDLINYCQESPLDFLVQEYVCYENEVGIFYYRLPGEKHGHITGIVTKEFLSVTGNGIDSIRQLVMREKRFVLQLDALEKIYGDALDDVPAPNEIKELMPYGNHARGAKFLDDSHRATPDLVQLIDTIAHQVNGFFYGRMDIRFRDWELLCKGKDFSIIELNGAGAEPTHMYDPKHSVFFAWKEIIRHWFILFRVSRLNHKKGIPYMPFKAGRQMFRDNAVFEKKIGQMYV
jgi:hypothetical protein